MKRVFLSLVAMAVFCGVVNAGEAERRIPLIGVVRIQHVFKEYKYAKEQEEAIKSEFKKDQDDIKALESQIGDKLKKLRDDPLMKRDSSQFKMEMLEVEKLKVLREEKLRVFSKVTAKRMAEFYRAIYSHFRKSIDVYAKYHKYDLIITAPDPELTDSEDEGGDNPQTIKNEILLRRVQYIGATTDVTAPIVQLMNQRYDQWKSSGGAKGKDVAPLGM